MIGDYLAVLLIGLAVATCSLVVEVERASRQTVIAGFCWPEGTR